MSPELAAEARGAIRSAIMDLAVDDYCGLWELRWRAATLYPDNVDDAERLARAETEELVERGLLAVYELDGEAVEARLVPLPAALEAVRDERAWADPSGSRELRVAATPAGEQAYQEGRLAPA